MDGIKIFTDSTSDLTDEIIVKNDVSVIPLYVTFGDTTFVDGIDLNSEGLYKKVNEYGQLPKTASPSPADFYNSFKKYVDEGKDIIYIGLSSLLSSTLQNAKIAAGEFPEGKVEVIDSLNLSTGIGLLVMKACDYAREGMKAQEIASKIREKVDKVKTAFVIDTLEYLYKGGRCSALQNFIGGILQIRPIVQVVDGKMILGQKVRGKRDKALQMMLDAVLNDKDNIDLTRITVTHSMAQESAVFLKKELENRLPVKEVIITDAGCVISSHCGPNTVGILYIRK